MSVLQRKDLEGSPLADLHAIASELSIESYRGLRKAELIKAILAAQGGQAEEEESPAAEEEPEAEEAPETDEEGWRRDHSGDLFPLLGGQDPKGQPLEGGSSPSGDCRLPVPTRPAIANSHHPLNASGRDGDDDPRRDRQV